MNFRTVKALSQRLNVSSVFVRCGAEMEPPVPLKSSDSFFKRLFMLAEIEEKEQYEKSLNSMGDWENILNSTAELERAAGYEQGIQQGSRAVGRIL